MLSGRTWTGVFVSLAWSMLPLAQPVSRAPQQTIAMQAKRVAFLLRNFTEVNMFILSSARGAGMVEPFFR